MEKLEEQLRKEVLNLNNKIKLLEEKIALLVRDKFGQRREKLPAQEGELLPWDESFDPSDDLQEEPEEKVVKRPITKRKKQDYTKFLKNLPREVEVIDLPEEDKAGLVCIGQDEYERLACHPAKYFVKVRIIKKYAIAQYPDAGVIIPDTSKSAIAGSFFDESFYASLLIQKFADHLPLYRLEGIYQRDGLNLSRQTMSKAVHRLAQVLKPLSDRLRTSIIESGRAFVDETTVKLLQKKKCKTAYFWTLVGGDKKHSSPPLVYYQFYPDRVHDNAKKLLGADFKGKFHSDAYQAYEKLASDNVIWQPCWAHARRNFFDSTSSYPIRKQIIKLMDALFLEERSFWELSEEEFASDTEREDALHNYRQEKCQPLVDEIFKQVREFRIKGHWIPGEKIVKACDYILSRETHFRNFLQHLDLRMDNNVCERNIRPLTIGRKNWLFVGNERGGLATGIISSLIQTCRNLKINPQQYIEDVLRRINNTSSEELDSLLPQNWKK